MSGVQTSGTGDHSRREDGPSSEATGLRVREAIRRSGLKQRKVAEAVGIVDSNMFL